MAVADHLDFEEEVVNPVLLSNMPALGKESVAAQALHTFHEKFVKSNLYIESDILL